MDTHTRNKSLKASNAVYTNKTPEGFKKIKELSDRRSKVYEDNDNNVFIAYRGTQISNRGDLLADLHIATNTQGLSSRFNEGNEKFKKTKTTLGNDKNYYLTGHSLGGSISSWVGRNNDNISGVYSFNGGSNGYYDYKESLLDLTGVSRRKKRYKDLQLHHGF
jgi:hypothetical protein